MPCQLITNSGRIVRFTTGDTADDLKARCKCAHRYVKNHLKSITHPGSYQLTDVGDEHFALNDPRIDLICG